MLKRIIKHIAEITQEYGEYCTFEEWSDYEGRYIKQFAIFSSCRILVMPYVSDLMDVISELHLTENSDVVEAIRKYIRLLDSSKCRYILYNLPRAEDFRSDIRKVTKNSFVTVYWSPDGKWTINARYMARAIEGLGSRYCYVDAKNPKSPIFVFDKDGNFDSLQRIREIIMPVLPSEIKTGFFMEDETNNG